MTEALPDRTGQLLFGRARKQVPFALQPPEKAAAAALGAYLRCQTWLVHAGTPAADALPHVRSIKLAELHSDFPSAQQQLRYPSASIVPAGDVEHTGGFTPSPREETYDPEAGTMVWQIGEVGGTMQLDIWCDQVADMDAFYARMSAVMNPGEGVSGLHLVGPPGYLSAPFRFLLLSHTRRDTPDSAFAHERRMSASIQWDAPDLDLRCAVLMRPRVSVSVL